MDLNVYLRGGGTRLAAYLGALRRIEEQGGQAATWAGVSAGGLLAAVLASGYTHDRAIDLMMSTDFRQFRDWRPTAMFRRYGLYAGKKLEKWLHEVTEDRCFKDLDVPVAIMALDIETAKPYIFSNQSTPETTLATAVRCSVSIPGIFALRRLNGRALVDGGLAHVDEAELFADNTPPCVTIRLVRQCPRRPAPEKFGFVTYVRRLAEMLFDAVDNVRVPGDHWQQSLIIKTGAFAAFDFELSTEDKQALYRMGYEQCGKYLDLNALAPERARGE